MGWPALTGEGSDVRFGRSRSARFAVSVGLTALGSGVLFGCGSAGSAAQEAAVGFYRATAAGEGTTACDLLAPGTRRELEQAEGAPCEEALASVGLPDVVDEPIATERFGTQAQVRFDADTVFLAEFDNGWKVVAAGCSPRDPLPYDCLVKGG